MERYSREILAPYLRDVYCAELLCEKLEKGQPGGNYLRYADFLDDLYALAAFWGFSVCAAVLAALFDFRFLRFFFAIASAAFLVSTLLLLVLKLFQGKRNFEGKRRQALQRARDLRQGIYSADIIPEPSRNLYSVRRLYHWAHPDHSEPEDLLRERYCLAMEGGNDGLQRFIRQEPDEDLRAAYQRMLSQIQALTGFLQTMDPVWI